MANFQTFRNPQKQSLKSFFLDNPISRHYTWRLLVTSSILTLSSANFAFDNQGFSQVRNCKGKIKKDAFPLLIKRVSFPHLKTQAMIPFLKRFGEYSNSTKQYVLTPQFLSFSNSFPLLLLCCGK